MKKLSEANKLTNENRCNQINLYQLPHSLYQILQKIRKEEIIIRRDKN